jgi:carbonic anhydrase/acetyltransferase-like protein (isoleucine patch superfamily)
VVLGERTSVWPGAVLRGDNEPIVVGAETNIQDNAVLHNDVGFPLTIGEGVSVGHQAMLHGCTIGAGCLIGIQSIVMNKVSIGNECLVGAGTIVPEGKSFEARSLILGVPGKVLRALTDKDVEMLRFNTAGLRQAAAALSRWTEEGGVASFGDPGNGTPSSRPDCRRRPRTHVASGSTWFRSRRGAPGRAPSTRTAP